jgi:hypothetical protein
MVKWLMRRGIAAFERQWNYDASYLHEIVEASPRAAWMFSRAAAIGKYRKDVPVAAWTAAAITAVRHEDCGPCTQLGISMAERSGVDAKALRAVLTEDPAAMPDDVALDATHEKLVSAFMVAARSGDVAALTHLLASDARVVTDGGGKVAAAIDVIESAERAATFLAGVVRKGWRDDLSVRFDTINGLPGVIVSGPNGLMQTNAFEIEGDVVKAIYIVRNPDKLRHLAG